MIKTIVFFISLSASTALASDQLVNSAGCFEEPNGPSNAINDYLNYLDSDGIDIYLYFSNETISWYRNEIKKLKDKKKISLLKNELSALLLFGLHYNRYDISKVECHSEKNSKVVVRAASKETGVARDIEVTMKLQDGRWKIHPPIVHKNIDI